MRTEIGKISAGVQQAKEEHDKTPLQEKLDEFGGRYVLQIHILVRTTNTP
jgi:hypothetical protein